SVTACNDSLNAKTLNVKSVSAMCDKCELIDKHDMCVLKSVAKPLKKIVASESNNKPQNFTRKLYERVSKTCSWWYPKFTPSGYIWKPKSGKENVNLNLIEIVLFIVDSGCSKKPRNNVRKLHERFGKIYKWSYIKFTPSGYMWKAKSTKENVSPNVSMPLEIVLFIVESGCSKHMTGNLKLLINFVEQFLGTVKFGNDQIAPILGYEDLVQGAVTIKRVYYVEGLNRNLFSVGQFCDADLEVAFRKSTCFIRDLKGN
nr:integrase, catalytic region, zinc finger, CCHC-type, peptidase aspartic, catalytic [Tanacetum cinerariifolium]